MKWKTLFTSERTENKSQQVISSDKKQISRPKDKAENTSVVSHPKKRKGHNALDPSQSPFSGSRCALIFPRGISLLHKMHFTGKDWQAFL